MMKKGLLYVILCLFVLTGAGVGGYYWYQETHYVSTEDARIAGDIYRVMPEIAGKIVSLEIDDGERVKAEQIVGQLDNSKLPADQLDRAMLRAPVSGIVIKTLAKEGEVVAPGQPVAMIVDPRHLYVSANIEETDIAKVKVGQEVDITVDAYPDLRLKGIVRKIGEATASTFSLLPPLNTSGNFTKVTQRIPVEVELLGDPAEYHLSPGLNTEIRIHISGSRA
ncbi:efflux RND transporter periplasmic adaptor subunit [Bacillaceae bacterium]